jgi:hypothetical protein
MKRGRTHVTQGMVIRTQHNHIRRNAGTSVLTAEGNGESALESLPVGTREGSPKVVSVRTVTGTIP